MADINYDQLHKKTTPPVAGDYALITDSQDGDIVKIIDLLLFMGPRGISVDSIVKTSTSGLVDTYTISYSDGNSSTFNVTNGKDGEDGEDGTNGRGIVSVIKTATSGLVDTYTITYTDSTTSTFQVKNGEDGEDGEDGRGIVSITKTGTNGLTDTYTVAYTDSTTSFFTVTNGKDGEDGTNGEDGKPVEIRNNGTYIQWRYVGDVAWINIIELSELNGDKGDKGKEVEMRVDGGYIQWRLEGESWNNLIALSSLEGPQGIQGVPGLIWKGAWTAGSYNKGDAVSQNGSSYIANKSTSETPGPSATDWDILSSKGTDGAGSGDMLASVYDPAGGAKQVAFNDEIPTKTSDLTNDSGFIVTETDPTVPSWAKTPSKPSYSKSEVGLANVDNVQQIPLSEKGSANGVATLDSNSKIPTSQLPAIAITETFVVNSEVNQLALTVEEGDVCVRTDQNKSYIHNGGTAGTMADWQELLTPTDAVISVAGKTGAVSLVKGDVGLGDVDNTSDLNKPVSTATQTALDGKQATITGGATTITTSNLTTDRALVSNGSGKVAVATTTATELGYVSGVTSAIQTQINNKANESDVVKLTGNQTVAGTKTFSSFPITPSSAPTTDYEIANKKYVDDNAGGSPGGSNTQIQYNNSGAFAGLSKVTTDGNIFKTTINSLGTTTVDGFILENTTTTTGATEVSPGIRFKGNRSVMGSNAPFSGILYCGETGGTDASPELRWNDGYLDVVKIAGMESVDGGQVKILNVLATDKYTTIKPSNANSNLTVNLPSYSGTLATVEEIDGSRYSLGNSGTSKTINWNNGRRQYMTMTGNCTVTFSNPVAGRTYVLELVQDATGSRTITFPGTVKTAGGAGITLSTTANAIDIVTLYYNGTSYFANISKAYA